MAESARQARRGILSMAPDSGTSPRGLGALLDKAETERRQLYGVDDRATDPATGTPRRRGRDTTTPTRGTMAAPTASPSSMRRAGERC